MRGETTVPPVAAAADGTLGDDTIAQSLLAQAAKMEFEANGLLAERDRLRKQAQEKMPAVAPIVDATPKKKPGRVKKAPVVG
jgi:hypothetical protein